MNVLALKPGHDGAVAFLADGELVYSLEAEKDSFKRHGDVSAQLLVDALEAAPTMPDIVALGGWHKFLPGDSRVGAGYRGLEPGTMSTRRLLGRDVLYYSGSHERSHILGGIAMAPFDPQSPIAVLVWEGVLGSLYLWKGENYAIECRDVCTQPGARYSALYALADPSFADNGEFPHGEASGKLMALAGLADGTPPSEDTQNVLSALLRIPALYPFPKFHYRHAELYNCGTGSPELWRAARVLTDRMFTLFHDAARCWLPPGLPLVITGGCGLNCEWNARWRDCGHFAEVFVPPCADDSGSAIGTAVDAATQHGEPCRITWDVYAGAPFVNDIHPPAARWRRDRLDVGELARVIEGGEVIAWVQGRCEIGPRALGHRSLLASAQDARMTEVLNRMKQREAYRPIAPICLEEDLGLWFDDDRPDPYMLYFRHVKDPTKLPAVTHTDRTARVQSVRQGTGGRTADLLTAVRARTGIGVLCNTSLNFPGLGFINRMSEVLQLCEQVDINHIVVDDTWLVRTPTTAEHHSEEH